MRRPAGACPYNPGAATGKLSPSHSKMPPKHPADDALSTIAQRFSPITLADMDLIRWFYALPYVTVTRDEASTRKAAGGPPTEARYHIAAQALRWFVDRYRSEPLTTYSHVSREWVFTSVKVPTALYVATKRIADRDDVRIARAIETAFQLYSKVVISPEMRAFYERVKKEGTSMIRAAERRRARS